MAEVNNKQWKSTNILGERRIALQGVLLSVTLNAAGQLLFKAARASMPEASIISLLLRPEIWAGISLYGLSAVVWLWVLARANLSFVYPILSLTFPIVVGLSALIFLESVSVVRWIGVGVIVVGVSLLAKDE